MMKKQTNKGITLISLVITIILLLILATVAISLAVDSDGLFSKAGDAANKWNSSVAEEDRTLGNLMTMLNTLNGGSTGNEPEGLTLGDVYSEAMQGQSVTYSANGQEEWIILGEDLEKEGNILITTKAPVENGFEVYRSAEKWLSYEDDLHAACAVYGGEIGGIEVEARSITMEDINLVTGFEEPEFETYTFGTTKDFANKKVNYVYPKAGSTWTNSSGTEYAGWKEPSAENETTFEDDWYYYNDSTCKWSGGSIDVSQMVDPLKGDIIWGTENDLMYGVASRSVVVDSEVVRFLVAGVNGGYAYSNRYDLCGYVRSSVMTGIYGGRFRGCSSSPSRCFSTSKCSCRGSKWCI